MIASAITFLFVPGNRPDRFAKALASGAGAVIVDWEDAVAPAAKAGARPGLTELLPTLPAADRARLALRINAAGTPWHADDVAPCPRWRRRAWARWWCPRPRVPPRCSPWPPRWAGRAHCCR